VTTTRVEVLVVGAGPSGLFAALALTRHGAQVRIVERSRAPHRQARATLLQPGTLEILARNGVLDDVVAAAEHLAYARLFDPNLELVSESSFAGVGCRWEFACSLPQYRTEEILTTHLQELGVAVERGMTVSSMLPHDDGVIVSLQRPDGTRESVEADRVVGAGGAQSITRSSMEEILVGDTYPGTALVADIKLRCDLPRDGGSLVAAPQGYVLLSPLPDQRWITFVGDLAVEEERQLSGDRSLPTVAAAIRQRVAADVELQHIAWSSLFRMHRRQAPRLSGTRRFLLGDAGHLSSPFGGEGLNSGLHDGDNLAWKLALVLKGRGRDKLIESFAYEREIADRHVLEVSDRVHQLAHGAVQAARTGVHPPPPAEEEMRAFNRSRCMLDVCYAGSPIIGANGNGGSPSSLDPAPGDRFPGADGLGTSHRLLLLEQADAASIQRLRERWEGLVDVIEAGGPERRGSGCILVRPDGFVGFRTATTDAVAVEALDSHLASYLIPAEG
jgi:2-polyprenyl-6-methoxyphenol hydroxylase-like FAD-dependent oxidoreductase